MRSSWGELNGFYGASNVYSYTRLLHTHKWYTVHSSWVIRVGESSDAHEQPLLVTIESTSSRMRLHLPKEHFPLLLTSQKRHLASFVIGCDSTLCLDDSFKFTDCRDPHCWQRTRPNLSAAHHLITEIISNYTPAIFDHLHDERYVHDGNYKGSLSLR